MKKSERLKSIAKIAGYRESQAAREVQEAKLVLDERAMRLNQLQEYYREYAKKYENQGQAGFNIQQIQNFRKFLHNLQTVIEQQESLVRIAQRFVDDKTQLWVQARTEVKIYANVITNYQQEEQHREDNREQSASDEHAQQIIRRNKS